MQRLPKQHWVKGLWGGENTGVDPTEIHELESPDMSNVDPSAEGGTMGLRHGRRNELNLSVPIASEWDDTDVTGGTKGGRITGIFEHTDKTGGTFLLVCHAKGVDHVERRGPVLYITTQSPLAGASVGVAYTDTVVCRGGKSSYTWAVYKGNLPPGLSLTGSTTATETISGTPTNPGVVTSVYEFTMEVTDSSVPFQKAYKRFSITVSGGALPSCVWQG